MSARRGAGAVRRRAALGALCVAVAGGAFAACANQEHPDRFVGSGGSGAGGAGSGGAAGSGGLLVDAPADGPPPADSPGLCGNDVVPVILDRPNLYFILDRSGSMGELWGSNTRWYAARYAVQNMLLKIGHRVSYGGAVYPNPHASADTCLAGIEVAPTQVGDPASYGLSGDAGPVLAQFMAAIGATPPSGGTPTGPTIATLAPTLQGLPGKTYAVLVTDGAPNCNAAAVCSRAKCMLNLEGFVGASLDCTGPANCCDPNLVVDGQLSCVDDTGSTAAIGGLRDAGIPTYVVGIPGSELYSGVLDQMAIAGGTARATSPRYYPTTSSADLSATLQAIGVAVSVSCTIPLGEVPPDPLLVNVYFDLDTVPYDGADGWSWADPETVVLNGAACARLKSGDVGQVQVVAGCPTVVP